jgi:hypothetical protein
VDGHCGSSCQDCTGVAATPRCDGAKCVECLYDPVEPDAGNANCRNGAAPPRNSPLGVCTPSDTCTCWVASETGSCSLTSSCPAGYSCAKDLLSAVHFVCLRNCTPAATAANGLTCALRDIAESGQQLVWAPMTTCYAFDKFGLDCSGDVGMCSIDGIGSLADGACPDGKCTYTCYDTSHHDTWCPDNFCMDANNYCRVL